MTDESVILMAEGLGGATKDSGGTGGTGGIGQAGLVGPAGPTGPIEPADQDIPAQVFEEWRARAADEFFELTESNVAQIVSAFDLLMLRYSDQLDLLGSLKLVSVCSRQILVPQYADRFYSRLVSTASAGPAGSQSQDSDSRAYYAELVNSVLPYVASESVYSASLALGLLPRLALYLNDEQLLDLITNVATSLEVFSAVPNGALPSCSAGLCLYSLATECIPQADHLHAGAVIALRACVKAASSFPFITGRGGFQAPNDKEDTTTATPLIHSVDLISTTFCQRLFCAIVSKMIRSTRLELLSRVDDVEIIVSIVADIYSLLRKRKSYDELALVLIIHAMYEPNMLQCLVRVPNYMGGFLSYCSSILFSRNRSCNIANACRGFLTSCLLIDSFLTSTTVTEDEVATIIDVLKSDLSEEDNVLALKHVIETCYDNYLHNFHVPVRAIKPLNFSLLCE